MPPFRTGLLKRKNLGNAPTLSTSKLNPKQSDSGEESEELIGGELNGEGDSTDSEVGELEEASDTEQDGVLYEDDADSTLGDDDENSEGDSDESSDLTDSEDGDNSEVDETDDSKVYNNDSEDDDEGSENSPSEESDVESGIGQTHSGSSGEESPSESNKISVEPKQTKIRKNKVKTNKLLNGVVNDKKTKKHVVVTKSKKQTKKAVNKNDAVESSDEETVEKVGPKIKPKKSQDVTKSKKQTKKAVNKNDAVESSDEETVEKVGPKIKPKKSQDKKQKAKTKSSIDVLADKIKEGSVNIQPVEQKDEYESGDTSDEEDRRNTTGDVPSWWYKEYPHVGYDLDGRRIMRPTQRDHIDEFLKQCEDPDFWRTVRDPSTGQDIVLSKQDLELIARIRQGQVPNPQHEEYEPWVEWFSREVMATPLRAFPEHKRSFLPSRSDQQQISRIVHALKMGWTKTRKQIQEERRKKKERIFYNLWGSTTEEEEKLRGIHKHIPAPKRPPPSHAESYNPPPEYLLDAKEMKEWNKLAETPWKRKYTFLPTKYNSLRHVPAYERFIRERFLRCLDLYLAPRAIKMRLTISPEDLVPKLPSPRDLQPFPTSEALCFKGHDSLVRSIDFDPSGQYVVSGSDDGFVKVWEVSTGRCLRSIDLKESVSRVAWTPTSGLSLVAAAAGQTLRLLNPGADIGCHRVATTTDELLEEPPPQHDVVMDERTTAVVQWQKVSPEDWARGVRIQVHHFRPITHIAWHGRGDYIAVTLRDAAARAVLVHQISRRRSQLPFSRSKGLIQCALFHPVKPMLFVATQRVVRVYDLVKQELVRKLLTGAQWISALAIHPAGDNLIVASYDRKCMWFDLELSSKPYQTVRLHGSAVRSVTFHKRYPLFATAGDDQYIVVSHGMVYNDLLQNPLIVPLKQLRGGEKRADLCVTDVRFHPTQPWLLAACADHTIRLYS